jgi:uncharacterized membrane protein YeaQ/YmgE (transglycosylase-associated protein family)
MNDASIGWIAAIFIGGLAGWIASNFMKSDTGIVMNILLGIVGAAVASALLGLAVRADTGKIGAGPGDMRGLEDVNSLKIE